MSSDTESGAVSINGDLAIVIERSRNLPEHARQTIVSNLQPISQRRTCCDKYGLALGGRYRQLVAVSGMVRMGHRMASDDDRMQHRKALFPFCKVLGQKTRVDFKPELNRPGSSPMRNAVVSVTLVSAMCLARNMPHIPRSSDRLTISK